MDIFMICCSLKSIILSSFQNKSLLRRALRGLLPETILNERKMGFGVPYAYWLRTSLFEFMRTTILESAAYREGIYDCAEVNRKISEHFEGRCNHGFLLYKLLSFSIWHQSYISEL